MWAKVGVKATLNAMPRSTYFPKVQSFDTSAYLFGWGVPTFDAMYTLQNLIRTKGEGADGMYNLGNYSNKELDAIIDSIKTQTDAAKRDADIIKVLEGHAKDFGHIPCTTRSFLGHAQNVTVIHRADNRLVADWVRSTDPGQPAGGALRRVACLPAYVCFHTPPPAAGWR